MDVAIDTSALYTTQAGVARYVRGLLRGLSTQSAADLRISQLAWRVDNLGYNQPWRQIKTVYREWAWGKLVAPMKLAFSGADVLHSTGSHFIACPPRTQSVVTLHDIAVLRDPSRFRPWHRRSESRRLQRLRHATRVVCVSQFSAEEGIQWLGLDPKRVEVVHNGCEFLDGAQCPVEAEPAQRIPNEFFLFVGSLEPGKNLGLLRQVYQRARDAGKAIPPLVILGARWEGVAGEGSPPDDWIYLGRQPDSVLIWLYRRALTLVFPSKYEGFGFPILEAMALGCPVICSKMASLPEIGGEAVTYAEQNPESYLLAMRRLAADSGLRGELSAAGRRQASMFTWSRCANEMQRIYRDAVRA